MVLYTKRYGALRSELQAVRLAKPLTQTELAHALGKTQSYVSKIETGEQYVDVIEFLAWCEVTGADACHILQHVKAAG